jgi:hypothetical protein
MEARRQRNGAVGKRKPSALTVGVNASNRKRQKNRPQADQT